MAPTFENVFARIGSGKFHAILFCASASWGLFGGMHVMMVAFIAPPSVDYSCDVIGVQNTNWTIEERRNFSVPMIDGGTYSKCMQYNKNYSKFRNMSYQDALSLDRKESELIALEPCSHWNYDDQMFPDTIISEWDLVCEYQYLASFVQSIFMLGVLLAAPMAGYFADRIGRYDVIAIGLFFNLISGVLTPFMKPFWLFLVVRFIMAVSGYCIYQTSYILLLEWCLPRRRSIFGLAFSIPFAIGYMLLPLVSYYVRKWTQLYCLVSSVSFVLLINLFFLKESPRWLVQNGRISEAIKVIEQACKINHQHPPDRQWLLDIFSQIREKPKRQTHEKRNIEYLKDCFECAKLPFKSSGHLLVSSQLQKYCCLLTIDWIVCTMVYYGLSLNSGNLGLDPFLYTFLGGLIELSCYTVIVPFIVIYGRRIPLISFFVICGTCVLLSLACPEDYLIKLVLALNLIGKMAITSAFQLLYLYSSEMFPTTVRTRCLGIITMIGRCGAIAAPFIIDILGSKSMALPSTIFGISSLVAAFVSIFLPETFQKPLPDTAKDVENWNQPYSNSDHDADDEATETEIKTERRYSDKEDINEVI